MPVTVQFELPADVFSILRSPPEVFVSELRLAAAVKWFEVGRISQGRAAELAGLSRADFIDALARYGVSPVQITEEDLARELDQTAPAGRWPDDASDGDDRRPPA